MKRLLIGLLALACVSCGQTVTISKDNLMDKIKGGWASQVIGCTYGGPTEFRYVGRMIPDSIVLELPSDRIKWYFDNAPGLYDDVYMDLTFVQVFEDLGLDAPAAEFAKAFAYAPYPLWHANMAARTNIMKGIMPPDSGHWKYNSHCDDIDFQIEADYAGLMAPGMVNAATYYADSIGHIMNYGDGWYGGVYMAAMYALAFVNDDISIIVEEGLNTIPRQSDFHACLTDVINWCKENPDDWKATWQLVQDKWGHVTTCPDCKGHDVNIDAKINSAYVVMGLLYGAGDYEKTMEISTRCGQDSDCNPASAAGILGTTLGYSNIPEQFKAGLADVEDINFAYTNLSLNRTYEISFGHALKVIGLNGGKVLDDCVKIKVQTPEAVRFEKSFQE